MTAWCWSSWQGSQPGCHMDKAAGSSPQTTVKFLSLCQLCTNLNCQSHSHGPSSQCSTSPVTSHLHSLADFLQSRRAETWTQHTKCRRLWCRGTRGGVCKRSCPSPRLSCVMNGASNTGGALNHYRCSKDPGVRCETSRSISTDLAKPSDFSGANL